MPGAMIRKPREKRSELGDRTAFTVCHAISMAITVVLPEPVAIFMASRTSFTAASTTRSLMALRVGCSCG